MRHKRSVATIALLSLVVACDKSPTTPTKPAGPASLATPSISVELDGPASLAPGQSARYTVIVHSSDGVARAPSSTNWIASPSSFLQVDASGLATGGSQFGGAAVTADVIIDGPGGGARRVSKSVVVLPDGTFLVVGSVTDAELPFVPVTGARVEVTPGPLSGTTDADGFYRVYGVPPGAEVRVTAKGYEPLVQTLELASHARRDFQLTLSGQRLNLSGPYTLAIDVVDGCPGSDPLPVGLQHRSYHAVLTQNGSTVNVTLTEPRFLLSGGFGNRFSGRVDASGATFTLRDYYSGDWGVDPIYPDVAERLSDGKILVVSGTAVTTGSAAGLSGTLDGVLWNLDSRFPQGEYTMGSCRGPRLTLTPR